MLKRLAISGALLAAVSAIAGCGVQRPGAVQLGELRRETPRVERCGSEGRACWQVKEAVETVEAGSERSATE